jgi:hypothetical protein
MLEPVEIRPPGFVQGDNFAVDNGVGGKIIERLSDLRESLVEVLVVPRVQNSFVIRSDSDCAIAVEFDFVGPIRPSGSCETKAQSMGSMNSAFLFDRKSS